MKKFIILMLIFLAPSNVLASMCVMDMDSSRLLYGDNENAKHLIASTTKIMTSLVVIQNVSDLNTEIEVNEEVLKSTGSGIYVEVGEHIKIIDLLYGLMLRSGNDAAISLATYVAGSEEGFAILMNEYASSLGMKNTHFLNASGLENNLGEGNTSTCYDMALLMSHASKNQKLMEIMGTKHHTVQTDYKYYDWYNKNKLLQDYKYTTGGKTGYTKKAYRTLVTSASKDKKNLAIVTLSERDDFARHQSKYEEYFKKYKLVNIINAKTFLKSENYMINKDINMLLLEKEIKDVQVSVNYTDDVLDRVGYVTVSLYDKIYFKESIYKRPPREKLLTRIKNLIMHLFR